MTSSVGRPSFQFVLSAPSGQSPPWVGLEKGMGPGAATKTRLWPGADRGVDVARVKR